MNEPTPEERAQRAARRRAAKEEREASERDRAARAARAELVALYLTHGIAPDLDVTLTGFRDGRPIRARAFGLHRYDGGALLLHEIANDAPGALRSAVVSTVIAHPGEWCDKIDRRCALVPEDNDTRIYRDALTATLRRLAREAPHGAKRGAGF